MSDCATARPASSCTSATSAVEDTDGLADFEVHGGAVEGQGSGAVGEGGESLDVEATQVSEGGYTRSSSPAPSWPVRARRARGSGRWRLTWTRRWSPCTRTRKVRRGTSRAAAAQAFMFKATAARTRSARAGSFTTWPCLMSTARRTLPSRLEVNSPAVSSKDAPLKKVSLTALL